MLGEKTLSKRGTSKQIPTTGVFGRGAPKKTELLDKIVCRFYYYDKIVRLQYEDTMMQLHREFDLSILVLIKKLRLRLSTLDHMIENTTTASELKKKYPWYDWSLKPTIIPSPHGEKQPQSS